MLPRAQKGDKFPRPFVQRRLLFSDEKKGSKFTRLFLLKTLRMTNSHRFKIFPRILPFPLYSVHRLPNFPSFFFIISFSLFIFIDSRSQSNARYQDRQCATMRQPATFTVPLFWLKRVTCQNIGYCRGWDALWVTLGRATRRRFIFLARSAWKMKRRNQFACYSLRLFLSLLEAWLMTMRETGDEPSLRN